LIIRFEVDVFSIGNCTPLSVTNPDPRWPHLKRFPCGLSILSSSDNGSREARNEWGILLEL
jgi:hypothetical protein